MELFEILLSIYEFITYTSRDVISADLFGIGTIVGSGINAGVGAAQNKKQRRHERQMADLAWEREVDMWNAQNEYNSPRNQMNRYSEAGLNPHLAVSGGNPGNASGTPTYQKPGSKFGIPAIKLGDVIGSIFNMKAMKKKLQQMDIDRWISGEKLRGEEFKNVILDYMAQIQSTKYDHDVTYYNERAKQHKAQSIIKNTDAELSNIRLNRLKTTGGDIMRDNRIYRAIDMMIEHLMNNSETMGEDMDKMMDYH